jgi:23S rRNA (guanosine2251-2'-O)-methyltransferase
MKAGRGKDEQRRARPRTAPGRPGPDHTDRPQIVFGVEPVREMLAADPTAIKTLYVRARDQQRFAGEIARVRQAGGRVVPAEEAELARMAGSEARHQGMVAAVRGYRYADLEELLAARPDPLLIVDGVTDPRNLGAIMRSAECAGLPSLILARDHTVGLTPAAIKTSAGAWVHLRIAQCGNVVQTLERLKEMNYWVAALAPEGEVALYDMDVSRRLAIVVGAEGEGLRRLVKKTADFLVKIPMRGQVSSLNVAVAAGIVLFEINRRRAVRNI